MPLPTRLAKLTEKEKIFLINCRTNEHELEMLERTPFTKKSLSHVSRQLEKKKILKIITYSNGNKGYSLTHYGKLQKEFLRQKYPRKSNTREGYFRVDMLMDAKRIGRNTVIVPINKQINQLLHDNYFKFLNEPLNQIEKILNKHGLIMLNEDGTRFAAIFAGRKGTSKINVGKKDFLTGRYHVINNSFLIFQWYKTQSGKFEVNSYLS